MWGDIDGRSEVYENPDTKTMPEKGDTGMMHYIDRMFSAAPLAWEVYCDRAFERDGPRLPVSTFWDFFEVLQEIARIEGRPVWYAGGRHR